MYVLPCSGSLSLGGTGGGIGVGVDVEVGVNVGAGVEVSVGVHVGVWVGVRVGMGVAVGAGAGVGVFVGGSMPSTAVLSSTVRMADALAARAIPPARAVIKRASPARNSIRVNVHFLFIAFHDSRG